MEETGSTYTAEEIDKMMKMADESGDDVISYEEFIEHFFKG